jgi:hypothetical protein
MPQFSKYIQKILRKFQNLGAYDPTKMFPKYFENFQNNFLTFSKKLLKNFGLIPSIFKMCPKIFKNLPKEILKKFVLCS